MKRLNRHQAMKRRTKQGKPTREDWYYTALEMQQATQEIRSGIQRNAESLALLETAMGEFQKGADMLVASLKLPRRKRKAA